MKTRIAYVLAWSLWVLAIVCHGAWFVIELLTRDPDYTGLRLIVALLVIVTFMTFPTVGVLIIARYPRHPVGWLCSASGLIFGLMTFLGGYSKPALVQQFNLPGWQGAAAASTSLFDLVLGLGILLLLLFPTGQPPSRWWRPVLWLAVTGTALRTGAALVLPGPIVGTVPEVANPFGLRPAGDLVLTVYDYTAVAYVVAYLLAVLSAIRRFWHAHGIERQQLKWFVAASPLAISCFAVSLAAPLPTDLRSIFFLAGVAAVPVAIGVAILRYHLYDVDLIINRTLVYSTLTGMLLAVYFGSVVLLQGGFRALTGQQSELAVIISTLAIAVLFQPFRTRIQGFIDHRFYRRKYDAAQTLAAFSARLRDEVDLPVLTQELAALVQETVQPAHVSLWLRAPRRDS